MSDEPMFTFMGVKVPLKDVQITMSNPVEVLPPLPGYGDFTVSGTLTCFFENPALLESLMSGAEAEERWVHMVTSRPHKAQAWERLRPILRRVAIVAAVVALSLLVSVGAG